MPPAGAARTAATFDGKSCTKPPHASFTNNLYASTIRRVNSLLRHPRIFVNQRKAQTIHAFEVCFGYSYCSLSYRGNKVSRLYVVFVNMTNAYYCRSKSSACFVFIRYALMIAVIGTQARIAILPISAEVISVAT